MTRSPQRVHQHHARAGALAWSAVLVSVLLLVAACGDGDGDDEATSEATPTAAEAVATEQANEPTDVADDDEAGAEPTADATTRAPADDVTSVLEDLASDSGSATVTIGDATYEFSLAGTLTVGGTTYVSQCRTLFGMIIGSGFAADGRDITVDMEVPPVDWETYEDDRFDPPAVEVEDAVQNANWVANAGLDFLTGSGVGEYEQDGSTASGSATFVNQWDPDAEPVEGTFAIDCEG